MMLFRNTSAFFLAVCTSFSYLTCPVVGIPPAPDGGILPGATPAPASAPCPGNKVALVMYSCDIVAFDSEILEVYDVPPICIEISSAESPSQSDLEAYDIIIVEGSLDFEYAAKAWLSKTGNTALVNLANKGKKVFFNAAEYKGQDSEVAFPAGVFIRPYNRSWKTTFTLSPPLTPGPFQPTLDDPDEVLYYTFNPLNNLPANAKHLMKSKGLCGSRRTPCEGTILAQLPSGLLLGTVQTAFAYTTPPVKETERSNLRKSIYAQYMCAPVSPNAM